MTIIEFLLARIAEAEAAAKEAMDLTYGKGRWHWRLYDPGPYRTALVDERGTVVLPPKNDDVYPSVGVARHIALNDPARVLAECAAKRKIIEFHQQWPVLVEGPFEFGDAEVDRDPLEQVVYRTTRQMAWLTEQEYIKRFGTEPPSTPILRALAAVDADHSDYEQGWAL